MTDADKPKFVAALAELAALKPGANLTPEAYQAWWNALRERWSLAEFRAACAHLRDTMEFMPNPFHFEQLRRAAGPTAGEAWTKVRAQLRSIDWQREPSIDGRTDRVVRAMGGYRALAMGKSDEMHFREKRFAELWEEMGEAEEVRLALPSFSPAGGIEHRSTVRVNGPKSVGDVMARTVGGAR